MLTFYEVMAVLSAFILFFSFSDYYLIGWFDLEPRFGDYLSRIWCCYKLVRTNAILVHDVFNLKW